jgi:hypothetical protein
MRMRIVRVSSITGSMPTATMTREATAAWPSLSSEAKV